MYCKISITNTKTSAKISDNTFVNNSFEILHSMIAILPSSISTFHRTYSAAIACYFQGRGEEWRPASEEFGWFSRSFHSQGIWGGFIANRLNMLIIKIKIAFLNNNQVYKDFLYCFKKCQILPKILIFGPKTQAQGIFLTLQAS